jgi:uncharacterized protein (TIGR03492 family)
LISRIDFRLMKLLCLSNGHGEDAIALQILQALQRHSACPQLAALPIVGEGQAYVRQGIPLVGRVQPMPSGGFIYQDGRQFARDLKGGLAQLTWAQLQTVKAWAQDGGVILAVGDIVPLLFAWWSGAPYAFVGTAKSEYYLRDEQGVLPRGSWFEQMESAWGSVYLPWERWLMGRPRCKAVFPRDTLTTEILQQWAIPAFDLGNPMMDGLEPRGLDFGTADWTFALLPGSRVPEAYENWQVILEAVSSLLPQFSTQRLRFLAAIAPTLSLAPLCQVLEQRGWKASSAALTFSQGNATLFLTQSAFNDCLHQAEMAIAMTGTGTEQWVGLGKPAFILPGKGPQFTPAFAEAQTRLLGISAILVEQPQQLAAQAHTLLQDGERRQRIAENGRRRLGKSGASQRIAQHLLDEGTFRN